MAKIKISPKIKSFDECLPGTDVAIVPGKNGCWTVTGARGRRAPGCARRIEQIQKELREIYFLAED